MISNEKSILVTLGFNSQTINNIAVRNFNNGDKLVEISMISRIA